MRIRRIPRTTPGIRNGSHAIVDHFFFARNAANTMATVAPPIEFTIDARKADCPAAKAGASCFHALALETRWPNGNATETKSNPTDAIAIAARQPFPNAAEKVFASKGRRARQTSIPLRK